MFDRHVLHDLATAEPAEPVVSIYARTDPRDEPNQRHTPAWEIELRNGLAQVRRDLEAEDDREGRLSFRDLERRVDEDLLALTPAERSRSIAWFVGGDGTQLQSLQLHLPVRASTVVRDAKPFVSPLVDVADRGAPVGVVLATGDAIRLVHIEQGEPAEPEDPLFELELGDWRPFGGSAGGSAGRGTITTSHDEQYRARVGAHRDRLFDEAAASIARRLDELGWERVALVSERGVAAAFRHALPRSVLDRVVLETELNLARDDLHDIADVLEPKLDDVWHHRAMALADGIRDRALGGGDAALGVEETLIALSEGRVDHLVLDPAHAFAPPNVPAAFAPAPGLLGERAVETAIATSAQVTALPVADSASLAEAGGMAAMLRY